MTNQPRKKRTRTALKSALMVLLLAFVVQCSLTESVNLPTPMPTPTPVPFGEWKPYNPFRESGWISLYPPYCHGWYALYAVSMIGPVKTMMMGTCTWIYQAGPQPEWVLMDVAPSKAWGKFQTVWAVAPTSEDAGWVVGEHGWLAHYESNRWQEVVGPSHEHLWDVQMLAPDEGWIVGENGTIWRYDGKQWIAATSPTTHTLYSLSMISRSEGWAVGRDGVILHYDGIDWKEMPSPIHAHLRGLAMISKTEGWAVGAGGTILHWQGDQWRVESSPVRTDLHAVSMASSTEGWAVGANGVLLHYNGQQWQLGPKLTEKDLWDVTWVSPTEGWAVGIETILRYQAGEWRLVSTPPDLMTQLDSVDFASGVGWATGHPGLVFRYDQGQWQKQSYLPVVVPLVEAVGPEDVWVSAVGPLTEKDSLWHFNGREWQRAAPSDRNNWFTVVQMLGANVGWAVGSKIQRYTDGEWTSVPSPTTWPLTALSMLSPEEGWAVGDESVILHLHEGHWLLEKSPVMAHFTGVDMVSPQEGWIIGTGIGVENVSEFVVLHYQDEHWVSVPVPLERKNMKMYAIDMVSSHEGWIVGEAILHYQDGQWKQVTDELRPNDLPKDLSLELKDIVMLSPYEGWAVGTLGTILHYNRQPETR